MESPNWQVTTLDIHLHGPRQTAEQTGTTTCGSRLGRSDVLRCLRHSLLKQNHEVELLLSCLRHFVLVTIDRLDDRSEENPETRRSTSIRRERAIVSKTNIRETFENGMVPIGTFPSIQIAFSTEPSLHVTTLGRPVHTSSVCVQIGTHYTDVSFHV